MVQQIRQKMTVQLGLASRALSVQPLGMVLLPLWRYQCSCELCGLVNLVSVLVSVISSLADVYAEQIPQGFWDRVGLTDQWTDQWMCQEQDTRHCERIAGVLTCISCVFYCLRCVLFWFLFYFFLCVSQLQILLLFSFFSWYSFLGTHG